MIRKLPLNKLKVPKNKKLLRRVLNKRELRLSPKHLPLLTAVLMPRLAKRPLAPITQKPSPGLQVDWAHSLPNQKRAKKLNLRRLTIRQRKSLKKMPRAMT